MYALCNHGISAKQVSSLVEKGLTLNDFLDSTNKIISLQSKKPKLCKDICKVMHNIGDQEKLENLYQLYNEGLSLSIIESLINSGIQYHDIPNLLVIDEKNYNISLRPSTKNKIIETFNIVEKKKGNVAYSELLNFTDGFLSNLAFNQSITIAQLKEALFYKYKISNGEILNRILTDFHKAKKIKYTSIGIKKYVYTLLEYLEIDFEDKEIFIQRLSGKAFQQLADEFGYSRQGAKNVVSRVVKKLPTFEEEYRYNKLFKEYFIDETLFCKLFNESPVVYQFLISKISGKNKSILEEYHLLDLDDNQKECLLNHFNCFISLGGEVVEYTRSNVFNEVIKKYSNEKMSYGDILEKYNDFITKHKLPEHLFIDLNSIRGILDRSNYIIRCKSHLFRYYDYKVLNRQMLSRLHNLLMLEQGIYSTRKLFNENPELMEELDIWTEYELHNLLKRFIRPPRVKYTRMPEFSIGQITKKDFLLECFNEVAPIEFKEFLRYADLKYGLRQDSLASYITSELYQYIHNDYIKVDFKILSQDKINELKKFLNEAIYTVEQFKLIGSRIEKDFSRYINNMNLSNIGYSLRNNYVLSNEYSSVDDYFTSIILSQDYFVFEDIPIYKSQTYANVIGKLEKNFEIIKVEKDIYITSKKLEKANISYDVIMDYRKKLLDLVPQGEFFTLKSVRDLGFEHIIDQFGFEDIFYERMISRFDGIATIRLGVGYIFKLSDMQISLTDFIYHCISIRRKVNLYDLHEELINFFGIEIDMYKIISLIQHIDIFYSEELQRFYIDKDEYYEEVFS